MIPTVTPALQCIAILKMIQRYDLYALFEEIMFMDIILDVDEESVSDNLLNIDRSV